MAEDKDRPTGQGGQPAHRGYRRLVLFLAIVFAAPALLLLAARTVDDSDAGHPLVTSDHRSPEYVFLGNSLLDTRLDPAHLEELLGGAGIASLAIDGSQSAVWYVQLKRIVANADPSPDTVFIFFHRDLITRPLEGLDRPNLDIIESLGGESDPTLKEVLASARSAHQKTVHALDTLYPGQRHGQATRDAIASVSALLLPSDRNELSQRADTAFALHNQREVDEPESAAELKEPFAESVDRSFLPAMIELGEAHGFNLVFVRVQRRPAEDGSPTESSEMLSYSADLDRYLADAGVGYIDLTGNPSIDAGLYYDSFHIRQRYRADYTELFLKEAVEYFAGYSESGAKP